jgi:hypothetical protein
MIDGIDKRFPLADGKTRRLLLEVVAAATARPRRPRPSG